MSKRLSALLVIIHMKYLLSILITTSFLSRDAAAQQPTSDPQSIFGGRVSIINADSLIQRRLQYWKPYYDRICTLANIPVFDSSRQSFHLRIYSAAQLIDFFETSPSVYSGVLYQWTREYVPLPEPSTGRIYCLQQPLTPYQIDRLLQLWRSSGMDTLRSQEKIKGWDTGLDGLTYVFESVDKGIYLFRSYWTPHEESNIAEERLVFRFLDSCFSLAGGKALNATFTATIPFYGSTNETGTVRTRVVTAKQYRHMKRERKRYRKKARQATDSGSHF